MIGKRILHYDILEELGRGGMGVVFKAEDTKLKRTVAIKFLPNQLAADGNNHERFIVEARAAAALNHPNITTIHAIEEAGDELFIVMEYIEGRELSNLAKVANLRKVLDIAIQIAAGLQAAHEKGVVHRDIKTANIMLDGKNRVKIMDFGLAKLQAGTQITEVGTTLGTAAYMSPEQARGEAVDHRTDIWSLGIVLFEMLTGELPFKGDYALAIIQSILYDPPKDLVDLRPDVPQELLQIVGRALEKEPPERYQEMSELLSDLESLRSGSQPIPAQKAILQAEMILAADDVAEIASPTFVGREFERTKLSNFSAMASKGHGRVAFVTGEAGSGKTALTQAFAKQAQAETDLVVATGRCNAYTGIGDPYLPFREILSQLTGDIQHKIEAQGITLEQATRLWHLLPFSTQALLDVGPDLIDTFLSGEGLLSRCKTHSSGRPAWLSRLQKLVDRRATSGTTDLKQTDLFDQYTKVLQVLARQQPLLLILDDLQWADSGSIGLLFHLGRQLQGSRILVIGTYRSAEVMLGRGGNRHPLVPVVNEFKQIFSYLEVEMDQAAGREFIDALVDSQPNRLGTAYRETLFQQTGGHPLFTVELLREMQENGVLVQDDEGRWVEGPELKWDDLPARVEAVIGERIGRLPDELRRVLILASLEGEEFIAEVVARLQSVENKTMVQMLSGDLDKRHHLVRAQGIRQIAGQRLSTYRFRHVLFQKYLYNSMDEAERAYLHEEVGTALENLYGENAEEIAVHLVRHFREAGLFEKALDYQYLVAEQARRVFANEEAITHYQQTLDFIDNITWSAADLQKCRSMQAKSLENLGDVLARIGKHNEARASFHGSLTQVSQDDVIRMSSLHRKIGKTWEVQRSFENALKSYVTAETVLGKAPPDEAGIDWWHAWIDVLNERIWMHYWQAALTEMTTLAEKVRPAVEQYATPAQRASFFNSLVLTGFRRDRYVISDETLKNAWASLNASLESGNPASISLSQFQLGFACLWRGEPDEAEKQLLASLSLTEKSGDVVLQSRCLTYLTILHRKRGEAEKVKEYIPRCETVASAAEIIEYLATAKANRAWIAWREGDLAQTEANSREALEIWRQVPPGHASAAFHWTALWPLIGVLVAREQISEAIDHAHALLAPSAQKLPEALTEIVENAITAREKADENGARVQLELAIELAQKMGYL